MASKGKDNKGLYIEGNEYWKLRSKDGRDKIFETPEDLLNAANAYFEWLQANPLYETVVQKVKTARDFEEVKLIEVPKMRPFTIQGLCNFIDMSVDAFRLYENRPDFINVTTRIRQIIYNQKFEGAASGFLQQNIIARDLGLVDKKEHEHKNKSVESFLSQFEKDVE